MDEVERLASRLNGMDPERPYFDPLVAEEAVLRHARLIGFQDASFTWAMGPRQARAELEAIDFDGSEACHWDEKTTAIRDRAMASLRSDEAVFATFRDAQKEAKTRIQETLHLEIFQAALRNVLSGDAGRRAYNVASIVALVLRDAVAGANVDSEDLEDLNEAYLPFADAMLAGLGSFWIQGTRFVCLPLPRLTLKNGVLVNDGSPAAIWPNGEAYAYQANGFIPVLQSVEW